MSNSTSTVQVNGRLHDPPYTLATDPRLDPVILNALEPFGIRAEYPTPSVTTNASDAELLADLANYDSMLNGLYTAVPKSLPSDDNAPAISRREEIVTGQGNNTVRIVIHQLQSHNTTDPAPALIYFHGGGMAILTVDTPVHSDWQRSLATSGLVVIGVDFRNSWTPTGWNPFPAGLDDCVAAVRWVHAHKTELGVSKILLQGESGGGNLALAVALRANREGWISEVGGVAAHAPDISGLWRESREEMLALFPSRVENKDYALADDLIVKSNRAYDPTSVNARNPLAFPFWAEEEDLKGLPPHWIFTDELDPLRDEGVGYWRKLVAVGVRAVGRVNLGQTHGSVVLLRQAFGERYLEYVRELRNIAHSL